MFSTACRQLVKEFGKDSLIPVPSLDEQGNVKLLQLVVMEITEHCFHSSPTYSYHPKDVQLTYVLQDSSPISVTKEEDVVLISDYQRTNKFSLTGKFGIDFHKDIDVSVGASDTVELQVKFNQVAKTEVNKSVLMQELMKRKLNLDHPFIKQVRENKNNVLCLVTGVVCLTGKGQLRATWYAKADATAKMPIPLSIDIMGKVENRKKFELDSNTALAYNCHELKVNVKDGSMEMIMTNDSHGDFHYPQKLQAAYLPSALHMQGNNSEHTLLDLKRNLAFSTDIDFHHRKEIFEPILNLSDIDFHHQKEVLEPILTLPEQVRNELTSVILKMISVPRDIQIFIKLVEKRELQVKEKQLLTQKQSWLYLLELAGITVQELEEFSVPNELTPLLTCFGVLLYAVSELQDEELDLIRKCAPQTVPALFVTFEAGLSKTKVTIRDVETISKDDNAIELLKQLGYSVSEQEILPPKDRLLTIDKVYVVMFALWGQKSK